jgi:hypothetical protein
MKRIMLGLLPAMALASVATAQPRDTGNMAYPAPPRPGIVDTPSQARDVGNMAYPQGTPLVTTTVPRGPDTGSMAYPQGAPVGGARTYNGTPAAAAGNSLGTTPGNSTQNPNQVGSGAPSVPTASQQTRRRRAAAHRRHRAARHAAPAPAAPAAAQ